MIFCRDLYPAVESRWQPTTISPAPNPGSYEMPPWPVGSPSCHSRSRRTNRKMVVPPDRGRDCQRAGPSSPGAGGLVASTDRADPVAASKNENPTQPVEHVAVPGRREVRHDVPSHAVPHEGLPPGAIADRRLRTINASTTRALSGCADVPAGRQSSQRRRARWCPIGGRYLLGCWQPLQGTLATRRRYQDSARALLVRPRGSDSSSPPPRHASPMPRRRPAASGVASSPDPVPSNRVPV